MQPEYGCNVHSLIFRKADATTLVLLKDLIASAILNFEPRITLEKIDTSWNQVQRQRLDVNILYTVRLTNIRNNMVYPFYFLEGTNLNENQSI